MKKKILAVSMALTFVSFCSKGISPDDWANQTYDIYANAINETAALVKDLPEAASVKGKIKEIKESAIQKLLALGKARDVYSSSEKQASNSKLMSKMYAIGNTDSYKIYQKATMHYQRSDIDNELASDLFSLNTITQYASLELLRKQNPAEAKRLGVE
ncbi:MAG: hypothetical protein ABUK01_19275 [Leptospirales bacterium]